MTVSTTERGNESFAEYGTYPTSFARSLMDMSLTSFPSMKTAPELGCSILLMQWINVDLPTPFGPSIETKHGPSMSNEMSLSTGTLEYENSTFLILISILNPQLEQ